MQSLNSNFLDGSSVWFTGVATSVFRHDCAGALDRSPHGIPEDAARTS
jgi:hypothetical protein